MNMAEQFPIRDPEQYFRLRVPNYAYSLRVNLQDIVGMLHSSAERTPAKPLVDYPMDQDQRLYHEVCGVHTNGWATRLDTDGDLIPINLVWAKYACGTTGDDEWLAIQFRLEVEYGMRPRSHSTHWHFFCTRGQGAERKEESIQLLPHTHINDNGDIVFSLSPSVMVANTQWGIVPCGTDGWPAVLWQPQRWAPLVRLNQLLHEDRYSPLRALLKSGEPSKTLAEQVAAQLRGLHRDVTTVCVKNDSPLACRVWASIHVLLQDATQNPALPLPALRVLPLTRTLAEQIAEGLREVQKALPYTPQRIETRVATNLG